MQVKSIFLSENVQPRVAIVTAAQRSKLFWNSDCFSCFLPGFFNDHWLFFQIAGAYTHFKYFKTKINKNQHKHRLNIHINTKYNLQTAITFSDILKAIIRLQIRRKLQKLSTLFTYPLLGYPAILLN